MKKAVPHTSPPRLGNTLRTMGALWDVNHLLEVISMYLLRTQGVTARQRFVIRITGRLGPVSAGRLARALHIHPGTLSVALTRLERRGLIKRTRDNDDARRILVVLTPRGRNLDASLPRYIERAVARTLRRGGRAHASQLYGALTRLADELRQESQRE